VRHLAVWSLICAVLIGLLSASSVPIAQAAGNVAPASIVTVNSLSDNSIACAASGITCLRNALTIAQANSSATTIAFSIGGVLTLGSTLVINNTAANPITIDKNGQTLFLDGGSTSNSTGVRIFCISATSVVTINGLLINHGNANGALCSGDSSVLGGAIRNAGTLTINGGSVYRNLDLAQNDSLSGDGGAINNSGTLTAINTLFSYNSAYHLGGAIYSTAGTVTLTNDTMDFNTAETGGALALDGGTVTVNSSTMETNTATSAGGAIYEAYGTLAVVNSFLQHNTAGVSGGAVVIRTTASIRGSTIYNNSIPFDGNSSEIGGGVFNTGTLAVSDSTFSDNSGSYGGGIGSFGALSVGNSTIANNTALFGGGIWDENLGKTGDTITLLSTLLTGNAVIGTGPDFSGKVTSLGYNLVKNVGGVTGFTAATDQTGIDPNIGSLMNNGGPVPTFALGPATPPLTKGSCAGNTSITPAIPAILTDQRGIPRKNPAGIGAGCDVGAFELPNLDSIGIYRSGTFYLRLHNSQGNSDLNVTFNPPGHNLPIVGDWASRGYDTVGVYDQTGGRFTLCTVNDTANCSIATSQISLVLGNPNDTPLTGRWQINATQTGAGVYRSTNGILYMKNALSNGFSDYADVLGNPSDIGVAGDWTGKGYDSPGIYRPNESKFYLSNQVINGIVFSDITALYGNPGDFPVIGDWVSQGHDGIGLFRQSVGYSYLRNTITTGAADNSFFYGQAGDVPVAGHWQPMYGPVAPPASIKVPPILIAKTPTAPNPPSNGSAPGGNQIGG